MAQGSYNVTTDKARIFNTTHKINGTDFDGSGDITTTNWGTSRDISISDSDGTNTGSAVSVNGSAAKTLKLPATIKAALTGNADTSTYTTYIKCQDTRNATINPKDLKATTIGIRFDFKQNSITGLEATYAGVMSYRPYSSASDWSGGPAHQLAFDSGGLHWRKSTGDTTWDTWKDIAFSDDVESTYLKKSGGTLTGSLTFANGTWNVVGDDCAMGDQNVAGAFCLQGQNGTTKLSLFPCGGGNRGDISWDGTYFRIPNNMAIDGTVYINRECHVLAYGAEVGNTPLSLLGFKNGFPLYDDPEFSSGNNDVLVYNNTGNNSVVITRTAMSSCGNSSGYVLQITTNGTASPGLGGFCQIISSRANAVFVQIFRAKIPTGYTLFTASNSIGTGGSDNWITANIGTGKWEWYARIVHCGNTGEFSTNGHVYVAGDNNQTTITWYLSYCNCFDITKGNYDGLRVKYADRISGNLSAATSGSLNIWVSSTGNADGVPKYISTVYFDAATKVMNAGGLNLSPGDLGNYNEGIRIHQSNGGWASIVLCGSDNTGTSGTSTNTWGFYNNNGNFYISRNGSITGTSLFGCVDNVWRLTTAADMPEGAANISTAVAAAHYMTFYRNAILIPYQMDNANDGGFIRCRGTSESNTIFELGTWDDYGSGETIQFNYYPTTSQATPTYSVSVPKASGTLCLTDGTGASGTWGISITGTAGGVAWTNVSSKPNICTTDTAQTITGDKSWGSSGAGGILYGNATNGGINSMRIGDDVYLGDCNAAGIMGMKSTSTNCGFYMHNLSGTQIGQLYANGTGFYINKTLQVHPDTGSYTEGIRIYPYGSWATIMLLGDDNTATSGTSTNSWGIFNYNGTFYINRATSSGAGASRVYANSNGWYFDKAYGAVWNDFAEYRQANTNEPGRVIIPSSDGIAKISTERLQSGGRIISDTFGFSVGVSDTAKTPIGVSGRVLAYPYQNKENYHIGDAVCTAPNGTVDIMTREEIIMYPERIIGIVNEIPSYEIWESSLECPGGDPTVTSIKVNGRIWIDIK